MRVRRVRHAWCLAILLLPFLGGCATVAYRAYADSSLPADKVARIVGMQKGDHILWAGLNETIGIERVDGGSTYSFWTLSMDPVPKEVYVLPGRHNLHVRYDYRGSQSHGFLRVDAEAGKTYAITLEGNEFRITETGDNP